MITEKVTQPCAEVRKSQTVRLLDVFIYGPFMVYAATTPKLSKSAKIGLTLLGLSTIAYNARNYILTNKEKNNA